VDDLLVVTSHRLPEAPLNLYRTFCFHGAVCLPRLIRYRRLACSGLDYWYLLCHVPCCNLAGNTYDAERACALLLMLLGQVIGGSGFLDCCIVD